MSAPLLELSQVGKAYARGGQRPAPAVMDVNLCIQAGEAWGLVGPSGAGKSTLARLALGLESCDQGRVLFQGRDLAAMGRREKRRLLISLQMVWQDPTVYLNPFTTALVAIAEPLEAFGLCSRRQARQRARELMAMVGLSPGLAYRRPGELSGGQCQRVSLARALSLEPSLLICDEALVNLDLVQQVRILELLSRLRSDLELSLLFISHDPALVRRLCTHLAVMEQGRLVESRALQPPTPEPPSVHGRE
ncbi:MAG: dipeptide/oligopeptide/nickel ABC transporter ATP-binding protein [Desulfarculaceae bacterium]|nr:dipeptide/oligopeptide/nickel ABC transporter ATP-binding protein [Desulfarculaceae bacterium]